MSKVITFARKFPAYHPRKGEPTFFVEKIWQSIEEDFSKTIIGLDKELIEFVNIFHYPKKHTIRAGHRWKAGDKFSPRVWSGKPYASKQIVIAPDIEVKQVWDMSYFMNGENYFRINGKRFYDVQTIAKNDGLSLTNFLNWFPETFTGQIICWDENVKY